MNDDIDDKFSNPQCCWDSQVNETLEATGTEVHSNAQTFKESETASILNPIIYSYSNELIQRPMLRSPIQHHYLTLPQFSSVQLPTQSNYSLPAYPAIEKLSYTYQESNCHYDPNSHFQNTIYATNRLQNLEYYDNRLRNIETYVQNIEKGNFKQLCSKNTTIPEHDANNIQNTSQNNYGVFIENNLNQYKTDEGSASTFQNDFFQKVTFFIMNENNVHSLNLKSPNYLVKNENVNNPQSQQNNLEFNPEYYQNENFRIDENLIISEEVLENVEEEEDMLAISEVVLDSNGNLIVGNSNLCCDSTVQIEKESCQEESINLLTNIKPNEGMTENNLFFEMPSAKNKKETEIIEAAKSIYSKRTRTLWHWINPKVSTTKLKASLQSSWDDLPEWQKEIYISEVMEKFGKDTVSPMINPQLTNMNRISGKDICPNETESKELLHRNQTKDNDSGETESRKKRKYTNGQNNLKKCKKLKSNVSKHQNKKYQRNKNDYCSTALALDSISNFENEDYWEKHEYEEKIFPELNY